MDMLEIGFYSAVTVYGLIAVWTVLVRLRWLPTAIVRLVHWPLNRLGRIPVLGRVVNACRRYSFDPGPGAGHPGWSGRAVCCVLGSLAGACSGIRWGYRIGTMGLLR